MLRLIRLFLPVVFPSWRFFAVIEPSPRIEFCVLGSDPAEVVLPWRELCPRPPQVGVGQTLARLVFNAQVNERLFLVTCAERVVEHADAGAAAHARAHIAGHVCKAAAGAVAAHSPGSILARTANLCAQFRIVLVDRCRDGDSDAQGLIRQEVYRSEVLSLAHSAAAQAAAPAPAIGVERGLVSWNLR